MSRDWTQQEFGITGKEPDAYEQLKSELAKVKKQLAIAVEALKDIYEWADDEFKATDMSKEAIEQIEELDK